MHNYRNGIEEALNSTKFQLDKIHTDIGKTLEKIRLGLMRFWGMRFDSKSEITYIIYVTKVELNQEG
jgi:hypothetical protein